MRINSSSDFYKLRDKLKADLQKEKRRIVVCCGTGCLARGSRKIAESLRERLALSGVEVGVETTLKMSGCHGLCQKGPLIAFLPDGLFYERVKLDDVPEIVDRTVIEGKPIGRLLHKEPDGTVIEHYRQIPFVKPQRRVSLRNIGLIDPADIGDAIAHGVYESAVEVLTKWDPEKVIEEVEKSGLRGCGGGGFPTGRKWRSCVKAGGDIRYIICNGDEGDPGAFMDRSIMEGDPHSVLEGMIIGAYAIQSHEGYIYVRHEYRLAVKQLKKAIEDAKELGLLGKNILNTGFDFEITINRGAGAFVCGESSALMRSIAGKIGEPRAKYIHSVERGLYDKPTVLNNVETFANIPYIIKYGASNFASVGTEKSKGTKVFSLTGKVRNTGLVEVPMGITLRELIFDIGGGMLDGRSFKAVQTGGPSGGCIPEKLLDLPVDFDSLTEAGSMMGSGGMIVMDDRTCMVDVARYFTRFLAEESCGKCVPCREGLKQLLHILDDITAGRGKQEDLATIERICDALRLGSLCAFGTSAANPVMSTLRYFREEYDAHIEQRRCPAGVCKELTRFVITDKCTGCGLCARACPVQAIQGRPKEKHTIIQDKCTKCGACYEACKFDAISIEGKDHLNSQGTDK